MGDSVVDNAIRDADKLVKLTRATVKGEVLESLSPGIQRLVDRAVKQKLGAQILSEGDMKMGKDELDLESIAGVFPGITESEDDEGDGVHVDIGSHDLEEADVPYLDEMDSLEGDLEEEIEIDEAELARHVEESLQLEVQMSKGFKDLDLSGQEEVDQGNAVHDVKSGEHYFNDETPPAKKDWTVAEVKTLIKRGLAENTALRKENAALKAKSGKLMEHLKKSNLFNTKLMSVNKIFAEHNLSGKQKRAVVESVDSAKTISEVKNITATIKRTLGKATAAPLSEGRQSKPRANASRVTTPGADQKAIRESVQRENASDAAPMYNRWSELAGIVK
ncbi:MAG: hypothetical protein WC763_07005 [Candidatus Paceibacterota bacterium]|jgi:hypothetical protein